jgi:hypothetical protein
VVLVRDSANPIFKKETVIPTLLFAVSICSFKIPFYGYSGVQEVPGFAAIFNHKIMVAGNTFVFISNPLVFILAIVMFIVSVWNRNLSLKIRIVGIILPLLLIELGKWEFLLFLYENSVRFALYGFWIHLMLGIITACVTTFLLVKSYS